MKRVSYRKLSCCLTKYYEFVFTFKMKWGCHVVETVSLESIDIGWSLNSWRGVPCETGRQCHETVRPS